MSIGITFGRLPSYPTPGKSNRLLLKRLEPSVPWMERGASLSQATPGEFSLLEQFYVLRHPEQIAAFLAQHSGLTSFLLDAYENIGFCFPDATLFLEVVTDPEASEVWQQLFIYIRVALPVGEAIDRLSEFEETWLFRQRLYQTDIVAVNLEFDEL